MFGIGSFYETQAYEDFHSDRNDEWQERSSFRSRSHARPKAPYITNNYVCKHCNKGGMRWVLIDGKYRMKDRDGNIHSCLTDSALVFKKRKAEGAPMVLQPEDPTLSYDEINFLAAEAALLDKKDNFR